MLGDKFVHSQRHPDASFTYLQKTLNESPVHPLRMLSDSFTKTLNESPVHPLRMPSDSFAHQPRMPQESLQHQQRMTSESLSCQPKTMDDSLAHLKAPASEDSLTHLRSLIEDAFVQAHLRKTPDASQPNNQKLSVRKKSSDVLTGTYSSGLQNREFGLTWLG
jgi:hypothetical protein